ncbi:MAG: MOSC domain-containing protein [Pseudomonadota bacterium]
MTGQLIGIAVRGERRAPMQTLDLASVTCAAGVDGDHKGRKFKKRQVTVLAIEDWERALQDLAISDQSDALPWTVRRANLLVKGLRLPRSVGAVLRIGTTAEICVTAPTWPCKRMDEVAPGLLKALCPDWRGGVTAQVLIDGRVQLGDPVEILSSPPERTRKLP